MEKKEQNTALVASAVSSEGAEGNGHEGLQSESSPVSVDDDGTLVGAELKLDGELQAPSAGGELSTAIEPKAADGDALAVEPGKTILVVHASVGSGHRSAANAVAEALEALRGQEGFFEQYPHIPRDFKVEVLDILEFGRVVFDGDKTASLFIGATRPFYDLTWRYVLTGRLLWGGGTIWARLNFPKFTQYVARVQPLAVVATHITAANTAVSARMLTGQKFPLISVPTDYETEGLWPHLYSDVFCVANEAMAETLRARKVDERRIAITGLPTRPTFGASHDRMATREEFGLPQDKPVVLALAGARLPKPYQHFRASMDELVPHLHSLEGFHFVIITGDSPDYTAHVKALVEEYSIDNLTVLGYVDKMPELMAASDLVICKSGGLITTECLNAQVPMILLGRAYGQEKANLRMLTGVGAAFSATTARELFDTLRGIQDNPRSIQAMLVNASLLRHPGAAEAIARLTLELADPAEQLPTRTDVRHFLHFYWGHKPAHVR